MAETEDDDDGPYVCPGCYAVGGPCRPGCIDAEMEEQAMERARSGIDFGFRDPSDLFDPDDGADDASAGPGPDDGGDDVSNAVALLEAALEQARPVQPSLGHCSPLERGLLPIVAALDVALADKDDYPGARSCVGCRELVLDDFEHEFCEPEEPTERMERPELLEPQLTWSDSLMCPNCSKWKPVELVAPPNAVERRMLTSTTLTCSCGVAATVTYSWVRGAVVALRYQRRKPEVLN